MTHPFRRVGAAVAVLLASIVVVVGGAPSPSGAAPTTDGSGQAGYRCTAMRAYQVFKLPKATEEQKTNWSEAIRGGTTAETLALALANQNPWIDHVVTGLYQAALDRNPSTVGTPSEQTYWRGQLQGGWTVPTVGGSIYGSQEFYDNAGNDPELFVIDVFDRILHRAPSADDLEYWVGEIPSRTRGGVAKAIFGAVESRRDRATTMYTTLIGSAPDTTTRNTYADMLGGTTPVNDITVAARIAASSTFASLALTACTPTIPAKYPITFGTPLNPSTNPAYTVSTTTLDGALPLPGGCTTPTSATGEPVLLVTEPGKSAGTWRSGLTSSQTSGLYRVCTLELPTSLTSPEPWDATRTAQYVARAVERISAQWPTKKVDIVTDGLGGLGTRWALRWWPGVRDLVDDVVTVGVPNHGAADAMYDMTATPTPVSQQSRADSNFIRALNTYDETPPSAGNSSFPVYTNIASATDRNSVVGDSTRDARETAWHLSGATNVRVQNSCPALELKRTEVRDNDWVWAAVKDALNHTGGTDVSRLASTPCGANEGVDGTVPSGTTVAFQSEPPLPDYVPTADPEVPPHTTLSLPSSDPGSASRAYTEDLGDLAAALTCPAGRFAQSPTLLVPGAVHTDTGQMYGLVASRFPTTGTYPLCWLNVPDGTLDPANAGTDVQGSSQYVVYAVRQLVATYGVDVDLIGHSRGGFDIAWAVKWWPDLQSSVDDVVIVDTPLRGSSGQRYHGPITPTTRYDAPIYQETRSDSLHEAALRVGDPTPGPATWTTVSTWDWQGTAASRREPYDTRQTAYRWPGASNVVLQQHCPGTAADHTTVLSGNLGWAVIGDALNNPGGADPARFMLTSGAACGTDWRIQYPDDPSTSADDTPPPGLPVKPNTEPALPPYVWNTP